MINKIYDNTERFKLYYNSKTFVYLKEILPSGFEVYHNGFIIKLFQDYLIFFDVVNEKEFPIPLDKILDPQPSFKRDMSLAQAKEIMERYYEKKEN